MIKRYKNKQVATALSAATAVVLGLIMFIPVAQAETPFDITACTSGTITMLSQSPELTVFILELKGIARSNHENKVFDNCTLHHVSVRKIEAGKLTVHGYSKFMDPDGDIIVFDASSSGNGFEINFLQGTGKWKGIKGSGKAVAITRGKPIMPGTIQVCTRQTGTFELPE